MGLHACPPPDLLPSSPLDLHLASIAPFTVGVYPLRGEQTSGLLEDFMKIFEDFLKPTFYHVSTSKAYSIAHLGNYADFGTLWRYATENNRAVDSMLVDLF
jgi:hypothetical protein